MFLFSVVALAVVVAAALVAVFSGHIPGLRDLVGAPPLQPEEDAARDFAASEAAGYVTRPDWGPEPVRLALPAADTDPEVRP